MATTEDKFTDLRQSIDEIRSSMVILHQAVKNENSPAELADIDNHLELIINSFDKLSKDAWELQDELFLNK